MANLILCGVNIIHKHQIALIRPQGRNERQVIAKLSPCMRGSIVGLIGSQSQVMFWVKNM